MLALVVRIATSHQAANYSVSDFTFDSRLNAYKTEELRASTSDIRSRKYCSVLRLRLEVKAKPTTVFNSQYCEGIEAEWKT